MYIAKDTPIDDPKLVDYGGPLMQWHVHENLCWALNDQGVPTVVAVTDDHGGTARPGSVNAGGSNPMVHVWIAPHECGPFAALEGHGAGQADAADGSTHRPVRRARPRRTAGTGAAAAPVPYDPTQADRPRRRRRRHAASSRRSPRTSSRRTSSACPSGPTRPSPRPPASTRSATPPPGTSTTSSGTGSTTTSGSTRTHPRASCTSRSPTAPRSSSRRCTCSPSDVTLDEVPDCGGQLMQWHIHDDLCFTDDPEAPQVARPHERRTATCQPPLVALDAVADDPRLDHAAPVRTVRRPRGRRRRRDQRRRGALCDHAHGG